MKECMFKKAERNTVKGYAKFHLQTVQNNICQITLVKFKSVRSLKLEKLIYLLKLFGSILSQNHEKIMKKEKELYWYYCLKWFTGITVNCTRPSHSIFCLLNRVKIQVPLETKFNPTTPS